MDLALDADQMITDDGREASDDRQATDAGDEDSDYASPLGVPESKAETLGFLDANPIVKPRTESRLARWLRLALGAIRAALSLFLYFAIVVFLPALSLESTPFPTRFGRFSPVFRALATGVGSARSLIKIAAEEADVTLSTYASFEDYGLSAPLSSRVSKVVRLSTAEEMIRSRTRAIIAVVADSQAVGDWAVSQRPAYAMRANGNPVQMELAISRVGEQRSRPDPATRSERGVDRAVLVNLRPKARDLPGRHATLHLSNI